MSRWELGPEAAALVEFVDDTGTGSVSSGLRGPLNFPFMYYHARKREASRSARTSVSPGGGGIVPEVRRSWRCGNGDKGSEGLRCAEDHGLSE